MITLLIVLRSAAVVFGTTAAIHCGYVSVVLWNRKFRRQSVFIAFLSALNIGMLVINAYQLIQHGTADAKAPVAAFRERNLEIVPGTSDPQQEGPPIQP